MPLSLLAFLKSVYNVFDSLPFCQTTSTTLEYAEARSAGCSTRKTVVTLFKFKTIQLRNANSPRRSDKHNKQPWFKVFIFLIEISPYMHIGTPPEPSCRTLFRFQKLFYLRMTPKIITPMGYCSQNPYLLKIGENLNRL